MADQNPDHVFVVDERVAMRGVPPKVYRVGTVVQVEAGTKGQIVHVQWDNMTFPCSYNFNRLKVV